MDNRTEIENFQKLWDKAQTKWSKDKSVPAPKEESFFGLQMNAVPEMGSVTNEEGKQFKEIYNRSREIIDVRPTDDMIAEAEGWRKLLTPAGKDVKFFHNPQYHAAVGMDQSKSPYEPIRVTPNFSDGEQLQQLNDLKLKLEKLENALLSKEGTTGKPVKDYKDQLDKLRFKIDDLSDKLTPEPAEDVT